MGDLPRFANRLLLLERVDELDGVEEAHAHAMMLDRLHPDCGGEMRLAGSGSAHQHDVVPLLDELTAMQLAYERLVHCALREVESGQIAVGREARDLHLIGDRAHVALGGLGLEQATY